MKVRKLIKKDAEYMLEWMHDDNVVQDLKADFASKNIGDCLAFIESSSLSDSIHMAVTDCNDEYMGTVSLKAITGETAEFAIAMRSAAMGKGYALFGMKEIIKIGSDHYGLKSVYWCVSPKNKRAVRFYDKNGFNRCDIPDEAKGYTDEEKKSLIWYRTDC